MSAGRSGDSYTGKDHSCIWFAVSCSFVPSCTHCGTGGFGALSQSISVLQKEAWPYSGLGKAVSRLQRTHQCCEKSSKMPSFNSVKLGGRKNACLRSFKQVPVFLNTDLEIYLQKGMVGTSPCSLSIAAYAQLPQRWKRVGGAEFGSEVCRVPDWYLHTSDTLFMQNNDHRVVRHCHCWKRCVNHGAVHSCAEWQRT